MATSTAPVKIALIADLAGLSKGLDNASAKLSAWSTGAAQIGKAAAVGFAAITAAVTAAGVGVFALASKTAAVGDEIAKMGKRTGFSVKMLSELRYVLGLNDANMSDLGLAARGMARALMGADEESKTATTTMTALGLSVEKLRAMKPDEMFLTVLKALSKLPDAAMRAAYAQRILGRSGEALMPTVLDLANSFEKSRKEAVKFGQVWTVQQSKMAEEFQDAFFRLKSVISGFAMTFAKELLPVMAGAMNWLANVLAAYIPWARQWGQQFAGQLAVAFASIRKDIAATVAWWRVHKREVENDLKALLANIRKFMEDARIEVQRMRDRIQQAAFEFLEEHPKVQKALDETNQALTRAGEFVKQHSDYLIAGAAALGTFRLAVIALTVALWLLLVPVRMLLAVVRPAIAIPILIGAGLYGLGKNFEWVGLTMKRTRDRILGLWQTAKDSAEFYIRWMEPQWSAFSGWMNSTWDDMKKAAKPYWDDLKLRYAEVKLSASETWQSITGFVKEHQEAIISVTKYIAAAVAGVVLAKVAFIAWSVTIVGVNTALLALQGTLVWLIGVAGTIGGALLSPWILIPAAVGIAALAIYENWTAINEFLTDTGVWNFLSKAATETWAAIKVIFADVGKAWTVVKEDATKAAKAVWTEIDKHTKTIQAWWAENGPLIKAAMEDIGKGLKLLADVIWAVLKPIVAFLKDVLVVTVETMYDSIKLVIDGLWLLLKPFLVFFEDTLLTAIKTFAQMATGDWEGAWKTMSDYLTGWAGRVKDAIKETLVGIGIIVKDEVVAIWDKFEKWFWEKWEVFKTNLTASWDWFKGIFDFWSKSSPSVIDLVTQGLSETESLFSRTADHISTALDAAMRDRGFAGAFAAMPAPMPIAAGATGASSVNIVVNIEGGLVDRPFVERELVPVLERVFADGLMKLRPRR